MQSIIGIRIDEEIVAAVSNRGTIASHDDVQKWINDGTEPPTLHPFRPYWDQIDSPWNTQLACDFATELLTKFPSLDRTDVQKHFIERLRTLQKNIVRQVNHPDDFDFLKKESLAKIRRRARRKGVSNVPNETGIVSEYPFAEI